LFFRFITEPVGDFMPDDSFHFGAQISSGTAQNRAAKDKDQIGGDPHLHVRLFSPDHAAVASQHLRSAGPILFPQHVLGRLFGDLNAGEVGLISDLLRQSAVGPLDDVVEGFWTCGGGHESTLPPGDSDGGGGNEHGDHGRPILNERYRACLRRLVSNTDMQRAVLLIILLAIFGAVAYWCSQRVPWIDVAAVIHLQRGGINCGHIVEPDAKAAQAAIDCAMLASESRRPFVVTFSVHGIDEQFSNAVVGDSKGNGVELLYATGMVNDAKTLLKHGCDAPLQLRVEPASIYHIPRLHCAPWPTIEFVKDRLLW
jgi:hypothetical protein